MAAARAFGEVVKYATTAKCRRAALLRHFGETLPGTRRAACCDVCTDVETVQQQVMSLWCSDTDDNSQIKKPFCVLLDVCTVK